MFGHVSGGAGCMSATFLAFVLLRKPLKFDKSAVKTMLAVLPEQASPDLFNFNNDGTAVSIHLDDQAFAILSHDHPVTKSDLADELDRPGNETLSKAFDSHTAHLMVMCRLPKADMSESVMAATGVHLLAQRLGSMGDPIAAVWASSMRVESWRSFSALGETLEKVYAGELAFPTRFWTSVELSRDGEKIGGATRGLRPLTGYDLFLPPIPWTIDEVATRLDGTVSYLMEHGPILRDGDTLGVSKDEKFRVSFVTDGQVELTLEGGSQAQGNKNERG